MGRWWNLLFVLVAIRGTVADEDGNPNWWELNQKVRKDLLKNYDKMTIPRSAEHITNTTIVYIKFNLRDIFIEDLTQTLVVKAWVIMHWVDERLKWDRKSYGDITEVHFGEQELWKPDLTVYNNADHSEVDHYANTHMLAYYSGWTIWVPPAEFRVSCPLDLTYWPFDTHTCTVYIGSWTTHGWMVDFIPWENVTNTDWTTSHWQLKYHHLERQVTYYDCCEEPYITLAHTFILKRHSPSFVATTAIPALVVALLMLVQFLLPVDHSQRITIGCTAAIMILLLLLRLSMTLPQLGSGVPLIVRFYGFALFVVVISIAISSLLLRLAHPQNSILATPPPAIIKTLLTGPLATVLCLREHASKVGQSGYGGDKEMLEDDESSPLARNYSHEWLLVAASVDRLSLFTFIGIFTLSLIAFVAPVH